MCGSSKAPKRPPVLPEAPTMPDGTPDDSIDTGKRRRRAAQGKSNNSTILTSSRGVSGEATTATKVLLGG